MKIKKIIVFFLLLITGFVLLWNTKSSLHITDKISETAFRKKVQLPLSQNINSNLLDICSEQIPAINKAKLESEKTLVFKNAKDPAYFNELLKRGDICDFLTSSESEEIQPSELIKTIIANSDYKSSDKLLLLETIEAFITAFSLENISDSLRLLDSHQNPVLNFYKALLLGDLLEGYPNDNPNYSESIRLFLSLQKQYPLNGAYPFFLAAVYKKSGEDEKIISATLAQSVKSEVFETYSTRIFREIWRLGISNPDTWVFAKILINRSPTPNYLLSHSLILQKISTIDTAFNSYALRFGKKLMRRGLESHKNFATTVYWNPVEYAIGRKIALEASKINPPNAENWPTYLELINQSTTVNNLVNNLEWMAAGVNTCERSYLEQIYKDEVSNDALYRKQFNE